MKKLFISMCLVAVTAVMLATSTFAWFSMNNSVAANGMKVKATTSTSLVISQATPVGSVSVATFNVNSARELKPAVKSTDVGETSESDLSFLEGTIKVDPQTGLPYGGQTITYEEVDEETNSVYYQDFVVYVASAGNAITSTSLKMSFDESTIQSLIANNVGMRETRTAIKVMVYVKENVASNAGYTSAADAGTYKGTLEFSDPARVLDIFTGDIKKNDETNALRIVMRVYFDGADLIDYERINCYVQGWQYYTYNSTTGGFTSATVDASTFSSTPTQQYYVSTNISGLYRCADTFDPSSFTYYKVENWTPCPGFVTSSNFTTVSKYVFIEQSGKYVHPTTFDTGVTYYKPGTTTQVVAASETEFSSGLYYVATTPKQCYVYTNTVTTSDASFGVKIYIPEE